jgi:hypothetical protein
VDKLERWLANELPGWLGRVITTHVEHKIDVRPLAQQAVAALEQQGEPVSEDLRTRANAADPVWFRPNAWELAYVVIDDLRIPGYAGTGARTELPSEVQALVAGVIKGMPEESMDAGLRRLRWMFLGCLPDILAPAGPSSDGATTEVLDPAKVGAAEIVDLMVRMSQTHLPMNDVPAFMMRASASTLVELADAALAPPMPRLARLQGQANILSKNLLRELPG